MAARTSPAAIFFSTRMRFRGRCQQAHHQMVLIESIRMEDLIAAGRVVRNCLFAYLRGAWKPEERMARMVLVNFASPFFYQLDAGVGLTRPNNKGDVGLVQFVLELSRWKWGGSKTVSMDGHPRQGHDRRILAFQQAVNRHYNIPFVQTDSAVDPIKTLLNRGEFVRGMGLSSKLSPCFG